MMIDRRLVNREVSTIGTLTAQQRMPIHSGYLNRSGLYLHVDPGNPSCYPGTGTAVTDLSGLGNNGTLTNGVGFSNDGGGCFTFDGTDDYITIPHNSNQNSENITLIAWVKRLEPGPTTGGQIVGKSFNDGYRYRINVNVSGNPVLHMFDRGSTGGQTSGGVLERGFDKWAHVTAVFSASGRRLYRGGIQFRSNSTVFGGYTSTNTVHIGSGGGHSGGDFLTEPFWGSISLVQCWNVALSDSEIWQHFNATRWRYNV